MAAVKSLCTRGIVLENGKIAFEGGTDESVDYYLKMGNDKGSEHLRHFEVNEFDNNEFSIHSLGVKAKGKDYGTPILRTDKLELTIIYKHQEDDFNLSLRFKDEQGIFIFVTAHNFKLNKTSKEATLILEIPNNFFNQGNFFVDLQVTSFKKLVVRFEDAINFIIIQDQIKLGGWMNKTKGPLKPDFEWTLK
jgi:lipopolysaccharide transport system ATP-binding protein